MTDRRRWAAGGAAVLTLAACTAAPVPPQPLPTPPPSGSSHAALSGGTFVRVEGDGYDQIYVLRNGGAAWELVGDTPKPPGAAGRYWTLAPDGRLGAFIVDGTSLAVQGVDGGPVRTLATAPSGSTICAPYWSADSARLTYVVRHPTTAGAATGASFGIAANGSGPATAIPFANTDGACDRPVVVAGGTTAYTTTKGELIVVTAARRLDFRLGLPIDRVFAVSGDAALAVVTVAGDAVLFDVHKGAAVPLLDAKPEANVVFDGAGHVLAIAGGAVRTYDLTGRPVATSPVITTRPAATVSLVTRSP